VDAVVIAIFHLSIFTILQMKHFHHFTKILVARVVQWLERRSKDLMIVM
jgi:hypothetical protein